MAADDLLLNSIKIQIRDNTERKWARRIYETTDPQLTQQNFDEIMLAVAQKIARTIGPYPTLFHHFEKRSTNRISFYIFADVSKKHLNGDTSRLGMYGPRESALTGNADSVLKRLSQRTESVAPSIRTLKSFKSWKSQRSSIIRHNSMHHSVS